MLYQLFFIQGSRLETMGSLGRSFPIPTTSCLETILLQFFQALQFTTQALQQITNIHTALLLHPGFSSRDNGEPSVISNSYVFLS
jgi:hypothetical protein